MAKRSKKRKIYRNVLNSRNKNLEQKIEVQKINSIEKHHIILIGLVFTCIISVMVLLVLKIDNLQKENTLLKDVRKRLVSEIQIRNKTVDSLIGLKFEDNNLVKKDVLPVKKHLHSIRNISFDNGPVEYKNIALTFDGGSEANVANHILDTLRSRNVKATMFLTGEFIKRYPQITQQICIDKHEIGNHTFDHDHFTYYESNRSRDLLPHVNETYVQEQLRKTDDLFFKVTGSHLSPLWRVPYGDFNNQVFAWAKKYGYTHIGWRQGRSWRYSFDSNDWIENEKISGFKTPLEVIEKYLWAADSLPNGLSGGIFLMHLGTQRKDSNMQVYKILGKLIDTLTQKDYKFVTISQMSNFSQ